MSPHTSHTVAALKCTEQAQHRAQHRAQQITTKCPQRVLGTRYDPCQKVLSTWIPSPPPSNKDKASRGIRSPTGWWLCSRFMTMKALGPARDHNYSTSAKIWVVGCSCFGDSAISSWWVAGFEPGLIFQQNSEVSPRRQCETKESSSTDDGEIGLVQIKVASPRLY